MDDSLIEDDLVENKAVIAGKYEKAHPRAILGLWSFDFGGQIGVLTIGHDSAKLWCLHENRDRKSAWLEYTISVCEWRNAVQAAEVSPDGKYAIIVGIDSMVHEVKMENDVSIEQHDNDYLDAVHGAVNPDKSGYVTVVYSSGTLNEMSDGKIVRTGPLTNVKNVSVLKYSRDGKFIAIGQLDGGIEVLTAENFKTHRKYEVHSMRIRKIEFLPDDDRFLSGCDDRLIKLHSLTDFSNEVDPSRSTKALRVFSAHDTPVTGLTIDAKSSGTRFASSSMSGQIFIWHIELTTPIMNVINDHTSTICALSFSPNGRFLLSGGDDSIIHIYSIPGYGEDSPKHTYYYPSESMKEMDEVPTEQTLGSPVYNSQDSQEDEAPQQASGYQEYRPYAEPRTPPHEDDDDDDIGDYVYSSAQPEDDQHNYQNNQNYAPTDYNPDVYNPDNH